MKRFPSLVLLLLAAGRAFAATPPVLVNSAHGANYLYADFLILHPELSSPAVLIIDDRCVGATTALACVSSTTFDVNIVADTQNTSLANAANNGTYQYPVDNAPYILVNNSFTGYTLTGAGDPATYAQLQAYGVMMCWAFVQALPAGTAPPITSTTVTATSGPASLAGSNPGLEFGMANNYEGFDTSAPSWVTAALTAVLDAMKVDHPDWNWQDIKAALRQTASNWATGWDPAQFGYGAIDYNAATAVAGTAAIYLQPPILQASGVNGQISITLYPYRSSRRHHEVVYLVPDNYTFPMASELTARDIANLTRAGGRLVFTSNATDMIPHGVASSECLTRGAGGSYTLVALTTDNAGAYSRVESWSPQTVIVTAAPAPDLQ
jgi:hypothetical protein